jgi:pyrroline-5-carboxylate reductase
MNAAIITGLATACDSATSGKEATTITLSPRNAEKAEALQKKFPDLVTIASDNQQVVDASTVVFVGVLPSIAKNVLEALKFTSEHTIISVVSTAKLADVQKWCAPVEASNVIKAIPLPPIAKHRGATILTPPHPTAVSFFDALGASVPVESEDEMQKLMCVTTLMGHFYATQRATQQWMLEKGLDGDVAAKYIGAIFHSISFDSAQATSHTFEELVAEQTPGGLNQQVIEAMTSEGCYSAQAEALDLILSKLQGQPAPKKRKLADAK